MPVLKEQRSTSLIRDAVVLDLGDLGRQAERLKAAAEARAQAILEEARERARLITDGAEQAGYDAGHARGLEQGLADGQEKGHAEALAQGAETIQQVTAGFTGVAEDWQEHRDGIERRARQAVLEFALKFAQKLTHRVIEVDPQVVVDQVRAALERVLEPTDVVIHIHPEDRPVLQEVLPDLLAQFDALQNVKCVDDEDVGRGGCVLGLHGGEIDASIDTQIQRITELILPTAHDTEGDDPPEQPEPQPTE